MILQFHEWLLEKNLLLDEAIRRDIMSNDDQVNLDSDTFQKGSQSGIKYWVINNAIQFLRDSMIFPTQKQQVAGSRPKLKTNNLPNPMNYSTFAIKNIDGNNVHMKRNVSSTFSEGKSKMTALSGLRDVTDSFEQLNLGSGGKDRYFINVFGSGAHSKTAMELYKTYQQLTKSQLSDPDNLHVLNVLGGQDNVKQALRSGANNAKDQMWFDFADRIERGENLTATLKQALRDDQTGENLLDNPRFVQKLKMMGAGNIIDQMKWTGASGPLTPQEQSLLMSLRQIDELVAKGQSQVLAGNPQVEPIVKNPEAPKIAKVLALKHLLSFLDQNGHTDLIQKINQNPVPQTQQPAGPNALDDLLNQHKQADAISRNPAAAMKAPMPLTKAESVIWRGAKLLGENTKHYNKY